MKHVAPALLMLAAGCCVAQNAPRVALIHSNHMDYRHRDDYDSRLEHMGWPMDKFENIRFGELAEQLDAYDILLGTALFNFTTPQDFSEHRDALLAFVRGGGGVVLTDCSYAEHVNWLGGMADGWDARHERTSTTATPRGEWNESHPLFTTPHVAPPPGTSWAHMLLGDRWTPLSGSDEGGATTALVGEGKGFVYLTTAWPLSEASLENLWTYLGFRRAGVVVELPDLAHLRLGRNTFDVGLENVSGSAHEFRVDIADATSAPIRLAPGERAEVELELPVSERGSHSLAPVVFIDDRVALEFDPVTVTIPPLLVVELVAPGYRGAIFAAHPPDEIVVRATVTPDPGMPLDGLRVVARLGGKRVESRLSDVGVAELRLSTPKKLGKPLKISVELRGARKLAKAELPVLVIPSVRGQASLDANGTLRLEGKPFFPIGIYHAPPGDYPTLAKMGFNSVTAWGTTLEGAREGLDAAHENGLKVVLEMSAFLRGEYNPDGLVAMVEELRDHPALLSWYTVDEPAGSRQLEWCVDARRKIAKLDPHHPVYLVSCNPGEFATYEPATEILAVDPYPIPHASVKMVSSWMRAATGAMPPDKPVWIIPQLQNLAAYRDPTQGRGPTAEEERCMVYLGLIHGAKGVVYYPYDDGPNGLVHEPQLMDEVPRINAELAQLGPELLACEWMGVRETEGVVWSAFIDREHAIVLAANQGEEAVDLEISMGLGGNAEVLFEGRALALDEGVIRDRFEPLDVHVYRVTRTPGQE